MKYITCEKLNTLTRRLANAIRRKNELIAAELTGRWLMAAEADFLEANAAVAIHHMECPACDALWREIFGTDGMAEDLESPFHPCPRHTHPLGPASLLRFPAPAEARNQ